MAFEYFASRVADARARRALRSTKVDADAEDEGAIRPLPGVGTSPAAAPAATTPATVVALPGNAWCVVPAEHPAHRSPAAAEALARALAVALGAPSTT